MMPHCSKVSPRRRSDRSRPIILAKEWYILSESDFFMKKLIRLRIFANSAALILFDLSLSTSIQIYLSNKISLPTWSFALEYSSNKLCNARTTSPQTTSSSSTIKSNVRSPFPVKIMLKHRFGSKAMYAEEVAVELAPLVVTEFPLTLPLTPLATLPPLIFRLTGDDPKRLLIFFANSNFKVLCPLCIRLIPPTSSARSYIISSTSLLLLPMDVTRNPPNKGFRRGMIPTLPFLNLDSVM
mmetsp:Transcript_30264/g.46311  ORF Transcript_30264/g.46311 Transcript_30264/m.46311 type:complete len:240 (-) Transcript_30264:377-1096(-)